MTTLIPTRETVAEQPVHDLLRRRYSPRAFSNRPVAPEHLRSVLEAARWAPSANNRQPWHFIVATQDDPTAHARLFNTLKDGNKRWAGDAPVLILAVAALSTDAEGRTNQRALYDLGLATAQLTTQATALGLAVHQMGGFDADQARQEFGIPADHEPVVVLALGYPGDLERLPEELRQREQAPRTRKPLREFVYGPTWGEAAPLLSA